MTFNQHEAEPGEGRRALLARSMLGVLPDQALDQLAAETHEARLGAGHQLYEPQVSVVRSGLVRAFVANGARQLTLCYLAPGVSFGVGHLAGRHYPTAFEAVVESRLLVIGNDRFTELCQRYPVLGWSAAQELAARLDDIEAELARVAFGGLHQRLAYHLGVIADYAEAAGQPVHLAHLSAAVASPRDRVSRTLGPLSDAGIVRVTAAGITVLDRVALAAHADLDSLG